MQPLANSTRFLRVIVEKVNWFAKYFMGVILENLLSLLIEACNFALSIDGDNPIRGTVYETSPVIFLFT